MGRRESGRRASPPIEEKCSRGFKIIRVIPLGGRVKSWI